MKSIFLLLALSSGLLAQAPPAPTNFRNVPANLDDLFINVPVTLTNGTVISAVYTWPHTNGIWIPEFSTNNATWTPTGNEYAEIPATRAARMIFEGSGQITNMTRMTPTSNGLSDIWLVRLRKIQ